MTITKSKCLLSKLAKLEDTQRLLAPRGTMEKHFEKEEADGHQRFRRRLRSQGQAKVLKVMRALQVAKHSNDGKAASLLREIKSIKHIKGMAILLVRLCLLHGLLTTTDLGTGELGSGQGLSLLFSDFDLGPVTYAEMRPLVIRVQAEARVMWASFEGTTTYQECNQPMQKTLLCDSALCAIDADDIGCEGRHMLAYFMGVRGGLGDSKLTI